MPDQDRITGWLNREERLGHFGIDRLEQYAEFVGHHFFTPGARRFFRSRILDAAYFGRGRTLFVTSEQFVDGRGIKDARRYTIRAAYIDNGSGILDLHIDDVGAFREFKTSRQAHAAAARIATEEEEREPTIEEAAIEASARADIAEKEAARQRRNAAFETRRSAAAAAGVPW